MIRVFEYISQILNFLKKNSKEFFILFPYKSPSLCLLSRRRITHPLYQKCHRHTSNFYHSRKSDKSANRPGHRLISVTYVDVQIRSNSSRIRHAYLARLERLLEGVAQISGRIRLQRRISGNYSKQTRPRVADR